jgi:hypothetical protein
MLSNEEKDRIATEIGRLFEGLELNDVAAIVTIQLAMLAAQGGDTFDDAVEFLDEIRDDAEDILETLDFDEAAEEKGAAPDTSN